MSPIRRTTVLVLVLAAVGVGQSPILPQGLLSLRGSEAEIGGSASVSVQGFPYASYVLVADALPGQTPFPPLGTLFLPIGAQFQILVDSFSAPPGLSAGGDAAFTVSLPNVPGLAGVASFVQAFANDPTSPTGFAFSNALSYQLALGQSYLPTFTPLGEARAFQQAVRLDHDQVLIAGGGNGQLLLPVASATTELYDPFHRAFVAGPSMSTPRTLHRATRLLDGRVLVTGGSQTLGIGNATAEIFDPQTGTFSPPIAMNSVRIAHTATRLADGRVLIAGGSTSFVLTPPTSTNYGPIFSSAIDSAEIFDPTTNTFAPVAMPMAQKRLGHAAVLLPNGQVLITGGVRGSLTIAGVAAPQYATSADLFDPITNTFVPTAAPAIGRIVHTLDLVAAGAKVIAVGGAGGTFVNTLGSTELYDVAAGTWSAGTALPNGATLALHQTATLDDGDLLIVGGAIGSVGLFQAVASTYRFDAATGFSTALPLPGARQAHSVTTLDQGVLVIGGADDGMPSTAITSALVRTDG